MLILITTVGILVFVYSDDYMSHDEGMEQKCSHCAIRNVEGKTIDTLNVSMSHTTLKRSRVATCHFDVQ
jgi:hypothetical protein